MHGEEKLNSWGLLLFHLHLLFKRGERLMEFFNSLEYKASKLSFHWRIIYLVGYVFIIIRVYVDI